MEDKYSEEKSERAIFDERKTNVIYNILTVCVYETGPVIFSGCSVINSIVVTHSFVGRTIDWL